MLFVHFHMTLFHYSMDKTLHICVNTCICLQTLRCNAYYNCTVTFYTDGVLLVYEADSGHAFCFGNLILTRSTVGFGGGSESAAVVFRADISFVLIKGYDSGEWSLHSQLSLTSNDS